MDIKICGRVRPTDWSDRWAHTKVRGVLGVLLTKPGKTVPVTTLVEWLWGYGARVPQHITALQQYISTLRRNLEQLDPSVRVDRRDHGYRITVEPERVDYHRARQLLATARSARDRAQLNDARALLEEATTLVDEPPIIDLTTEPAEKFRESADTTVVLPAHEQLLSTLLELGDPQSALVRLDDLQSSHPLSVLFAKRRIDALCASDGFREAREYFQRAYRNLRSEGLANEAEALLRHHRTAEQQRRAAHPSRPRTPSEPIPTKPAPPESGSRATGSAPKHRVVPYRLPHERKDLVDRSGLLHELDTRTEHGRAPGIVVLSGTAGIGKTALAVHWASRVRTQAPGGVLYADLQGFSNNPRWEASDVVRKFLHDFQVSADRLGTEDDRRVKLSSLLAEDHAILVLDNVNEPEQVTPLLDLAPNALLLVTSRRHQDYLTVHWAATELHVPTISAVEGERWLRRTIGTRRQLEPRALAELVSLCAGIPLVYCLIGTYIAKRPRASLPNIVDDLREEQRLLTIGDTVGSIDTTLHATFFLSYHALSPGAQRLFRLLSYHPLPSIARGASVALNGMDRKTTLDQLDELISANLIEQYNGHYAWHDVIHEFASVQAAGDEPPEHRRQAIDRMVSWFLTSAENAELVLLPFRPSVPPIAHDADVIADEFRDEQQAFQWFVRERLAVIAVLRLAHTEGLHAYVWRLANKSNEAFKRQGYYHDALTGLQLALASLDISPEEGARAGTLNNIGYVCMETRNFSTAYEHFRRAYELSEDSRDPRVIAIAMHNMAFYSFRTHNHAEAERLYAQALRISTESAMDDVRANTLRRIGQLRFALGDLAEANTLYHQSLALHEKVRNTQGIGQALHHLGQLCLARDDHASTIDFGHRALRYELRGHDLTTFAETLNILAAAHQRRGQDRDAAEYARESCRVCWRTGNIETEAAALDLLATSMLAVGRRAAAIEGWERAEELYRDLRDDSWVTVRDKLREMSIHDG